MKDTRVRQRLNSLFADFERLAADPAYNTPLMQRKLESMRTRLEELEKQVAEDKKISGTYPDEITSSHAPSTNSALYEKDKIGYAYSNDKIESLHNLDLINPNVNHNLTSPLTIGGQAIGELQIEPLTQRKWTSEETDLAKAVADQASVQIQNLRLLSATERSRAEAQTATRRFMHEGWDSYLDAIHNNERIGYAYDQAAVTPYTGTLHANGGVRELVKVMGEQVGALYLTPDPLRPLSIRDMALVRGVANQIAQQVENIRLLADASRARAETEEALRRLTHDTWQSYTDQKSDSSLSFGYDSIRVTPFEEASLPQDVILIQPLIVRGETVGRLAVTGRKNASPEATDLAAAVATQASLHLETLRLSEELQKRATELLQLDHLKSAFLANMSHELRTPLNSVLGFADVILEGLDGPLTENMKTDLNLIQKNGQHLLHLINDVLDMAKIEAGRMNLNLEKFKIHEILNEVISITSTLIGEKNLSVFIESGSDQHLELFADRTRIRQVMINLVNNAIKFTENGEVVIRADPREGASVLIKVKDTGVGIASDKLDSVFQEFIQVDSSTTRKAGGTGLGLPISRRLVEMHGGRVWAESSGVAGEGTAFNVELPLEAVVQDG